MVMRFPIILTMNSLFQKDFEMPTCGHVMSWWEKDKALRSLWEIEDKNAKSMLEYTSVSLGYFTREEIEEAYEKFEDEKAEAEAGEDL